MVPPRFPSIILKRGNGGLKRGGALASGQRVHPSPVAAAFSQALMVELYVITFGSKRRSRMSENMPRASCHRAPFSQALMAALCVIKLEFQQHTSAKIDLECTSAV